MKRPPEIDRFIHHDDGDAEEAAFKMPPYLDYLEDRICKLERVRDAATRAEAAMDTAAFSGVREILPPGYRDSWAKHHVELIEALEACDDPPQEDCELEKAVRQMSDNQLIETFQNLVSELNSRVKRNCGEITDANS